MQEGTQTLQQQNTDLVNKATAQQEQMLQYVEGLMQALQTYLPFMIAVALVVFLLLAFNSLQKMRVDRAIIRMDRNIEKLVNQLSNSHSSSTGDTPANMYAQKGSSGSGGPVAATVNSDSEQQPPKGWYE
jgi:hypothetical protein